MTPDQMNYQLQNQLQHYNSMSGGSLLGWIFLLLVIGAVICSVDHRFFGGLYRWWYDARRDEDHKLAADAKMGFIYGQPARVKFSWAFGIVLSYIIWCVWFQGASPISTILNGVPETIFIMIGFYLAPLFDQAKDYLNPALDRIDALEKEGFKVEGVRERATGWIRQVFPARKATPESVTPPVVSSHDISPEATPTALEPKRDLIGEFAQGGHVSQSKGDGNGSVNEH